MAEPGRQRTFGEAFGALVRRKRKIAGLNQNQLAEDAFGTSAKVRRISEIENGLVANPQSKTIDPLINVLGITDEELEACIADAPWQPDAELERAFREARALLEAAAARFELASPDASLSDIEDHLRAKAEEWRELRERIEEIDAAGDRIDELRIRALSALSDGQLDKVDDLLLEAEEAQQRERTLLEVGRQVELRILRGDAAMIADDGDRAFTLYRDAARMFDSFDPEMGAETLATLAGKVYETARRSLVSRFDIARRLLDELASHPSVAADDVARGIADYRRSIIYNREGVGTDGEVRIELVRQALDFAASAVRLLPVDEEVDFAIFSRIQLGNVHLSLAREHPDADHPALALEVFRSALVMAQEDLPQFLAMVHNSQGSAYMAERRGHEDDERRRPLENALEQFTLAIEAAEAHSVTDVWGSARLNRGLALAEFAGRYEADTRRRRFLRVRACADFDASMETFPSVLFPDQFAEANAALAKTLAQAALDEPGPLGDHYSIRALDSLAAASGYFTRRGHPVRWSELHVLAGSLFTERAHRAATAGLSPDGEIEQAKRCFEGAADTFESVGRLDQAASCRFTANEVGDKFRDAAASTAND